MADQNLNNMTVTWNSGGTTFAGIKLNVTDTASALGSLLLQLQVGGSNKFTVSKSGQTDIGGSTTISGNATISGNVSIGGTLSAAAITGAVTKAASSTDNAIARFDGTTGGVIQNSGVIIDDSNNITGVNNVTMGGGVADGAKLDASAALIFATGSPAIAIFASKSATGGIRLRPNGGASGTSITGQVQIDTTGNMTVNGSVTATAFNISSDASLKENFRSFDSGSIIDALEFGQFEWIDSGKTAFGVLAQDAERAFPYAISVSDGGKYQADYSKFVPAAMAELKDMRRRLSAAGL